MVTNTLNPVLGFTQNWNNKLNCWSFTTIRLDNPKYYKGAIFDVHLNKEKKGTVMVNAVERLKLADFTPRLAFLDIGYGVQYLDRLLRTMYSKKVLHIDAATFVIVTCSWMGEVPNTIAAPKARKIVKETQSKMYPVAE